MSQENKGVIELLYSAFRNYFFTKLIASAASKEIKISVHIHTIILYFVHFISLQQVTIE